MWSMPVLWLGGYLDVVMAVNLLLTYFDLPNSCGYIKLTSLSVKGAEMLLEKSVLSGDMFLIIGTKFDFRIHWTFHERRTLYVLYYTLSIILTCGQYYKHFTLVIYDSRVVLTKKCISRVVNYKHKVVVRLTPGDEETNPDRHTFSTRHSFGNATFGPY